MNNYFYAKKLYKIPENKKVKASVIYLFTFFISIYLVTASVNFYNTDVAQLRLEVAKSIIERLDLSVPDAIGIQGYDGRYYSWFGLGTVLLAIPFYLAGKLIGSPAVVMSIMNQIVSAGTVLIIFRFVFALGYSMRTSVLVSIFYGLGTMAWPQAKHPFDHPVETFFVLLSVYSMYRYSTIRVRLNLIISAFSFGMAFITRNTSVLIMPSLAVLLVAFSYKKLDTKWLREATKDFLIFFVVFLPFVILFFWYNYYRFGSIFETGYSLIAERTGLDFFTGTTLMTGLKGFFISPGKGFFYYSPVAILFFFSIRPFIKKNIGMAISFIFIVLSYLLFYSRNVYWHGDWAWGPRYLLVLTPFIVIPIAGLFNSDKWLKRNYFRRFIYFIFSIGLIIQVVAVSVDFQNYFTVLQDEKVEFTIVYGEGVQPIFEPPSYIYFDWSKSPIFTQFKFIYNIAARLKNYSYVETPNDANLNEIREASPSMNVFDFWWLYRYYILNDYYGFIVALLLLLMAILSALRLKTILKNEI